MNGTTDGGNLSAVPPPAVHAIPVRGRVAQCVGVDVGYGFMICNEIDSNNERVLVNKMDAYEAIKDA